MFLLPSFSRPEAPASQRLSGPAPFTALRKLGRVVLLTALIFSLTLNDAEAARKKKAEPQPNNKYASIVIDARTGMVLSQDNADRSLHPASLTKIMTMVLVFDALQSGKITQRTQLVASSRGASMPPSRVGLRPGQTISVYDALRTLATKSANDVAVTVAENLGGSEQRFVMLMNLKARQIGMTNTTFVNASGLHDNRQFSSARDMAKLAKFLIDSYPQYYSIFGVKSYSYGGKILRNHNRLMESYQGMDGIKTGYVAASGFNLVASARRGDTRLIGVVFGGKTTNSRNEHMRDLLDKGFVKFAQMRMTGKYGQALNSVPAPAVLPPLSQSGAIALPPRKPGAAPILQSTVPPDIPAAPATSYSHFAQTNAAPLPVPVEAAPVTVTAPAAVPPMKTLGTIAVSPSNPAGQTLPSQAAPASGLNSMGDWQIQIGAFEDRAGTNQALYSAMSKLPKTLNKGKTLVVPLRTTDGKWIFRARLGGYTQNEATQACSYLRDCLTIPPQGN